MSDKQPHIDEITKFLSGEANEIEANELMDWVVSSEENMDKFAQLSKTWSVAKTKGKRFFKPDRAWSKVNKRISHKHRYSMFMTVGVAAAVVVLFVVFAQLFTDPKDTPMFAMSSSDSTVNTVLPDGSDIVLAENSSIEYQFDKKNNTRLSTLTGKAYFNVKRDEKQRFIVKTNYGGVEVLGTKFSVNVLEDTDVKVNVLSGRVKLFLSEETGDTLFLIITDGETAVISMRNDTIIRHEQEASAFFNINKTILFNNVELKTLIAELEKCYSANIKIDKEVNENLKFSSSFKDKSLIEILDVVTEVLELEYVDDNGAFIITNRAQ